MQGSNKAHLIDSRNRELEMPSDDDHRRQAVVPDDDGKVVREIPVSDGSSAEHKEWLKEMRGWLVVLATLAA